MDLPFLWETFLSLVAAVPLTLQLAATAIVLGVFLALGLALSRLSGILPLDWFARAYIFVFRGTPLLVQIFLIYYGLGQFREVRQSMLWVVLRDPYWCAVIALMLNTAAYSAEIIRSACSRSRSARSKRRAPAACPISWPFGALPCRSRSARLCPVIPTR